MREIIEGELFDRYLYCNSSDVPPFIKDKAKGLDSGTVIAIIGFDNNEFVKEAEKAVLLNFALAIHIGRLDVTMSEGRNTVEISNQNIFCKLETFSKSPSLQKRERNRFSEVDNNLKTFTKGKGGNMPSPFEDCEVKIRHESGLRSKVAILRNGMFITNDHMAFQKNHFEGKKPFDTVVVIDGSKEGKAHNLVKDAENPLHNCVEEERIREEERRNLLTGRKKGGLLHTIREWIKQHTEEIDMEETELDDIVIRTPGIEEKIEIARRRAKRQDRRHNGNEEEAIPNDEPPRRKPEKTTKTDKKRRHSLEEYGKRV